MTDTPLLSLLVWLPIAGGIALLALDAVGNKACRQTALVVALATFLLSLLLYTGFDLETAAMQFQEKHSWIAAFDVHYHLGVDGISMPLIILTTFTTVLVVLAGWQVIQNRTRLLGSDAGADVPDYRYLGWSEPGLCDHQVLPLYLSWFGVHAGRTDLHVPEVRQLQHP